MKSQEGNIINVFCEECGVVIEVEETDDCSLCEDCAAQYDTDSDNFPLDFNED